MSSVFVCHVNAPLFHHQVLGICTTGLSAIVREWDQVVLERSPLVVQAGVQRGASLRRLRQLAPAAQCYPANETLALQQHQALIVALQVYTAHIETRRLGQLWADFTQQRRLWPSEQALVSHMRQTLAEANLHVGIGIASNKFCARLAAQQTANWRFVPAQQTAAFLAEQRLTVLPNPPKLLLQRLALLGIHTLGAFAALPRNSIPLQFGRESVFFYDLANGRDTRPVQAKAAAPFVEQHWQSDAPLHNKAQLLALGSTMLPTLSADLTALGQTTTALSLDVVPLLGATVHVGQHLKHPTKRTADLQLHWQDLVAKLPATTEITQLTLRAYPLQAAHIGQAQLTLFEHAAAEKKAPLQHAIRRIIERFGTQAIRLVAEIGPPQPIPINVDCNDTLQPQALQLHTRKHQVRLIAERWFDVWVWNDQPERRHYFHITVGDDIPLTIFRDANDDWFWDRRIEWDRS